MKDLIKTRDERSMVCSSCTKRLLNKAVYCIKCRKALHSVNSKVSKMIDAEIYKITHEGYRVPSRDYRVVAKFGDERNCKLCKININHRSQSATYCRSCAKILGKVRTKAGCLLRAKKNELRDEYLKEVKRKYDKLGTL